MNHPAIGVPPFCPTLELKKDTLLVQPETGSNRFLAETKRLRLDAAMHVGRSKMGRNGDGIAAVPHPGQNQQTWKENKHFIPQTQAAFFQTWEGNLSVSTVFCCFKIFPWKLLASAPKVYPETFLAILAAFPMNYIVWDPGRLWSCWAGFGDRSKKDHKDGVPWVSRASISMLGV